MEDLAHKIHASGQLPPPVVPRAAAPALELQLLEETAILS